MFLQITDFGQEAIKIFGAFAGILGLLYIAVRYQTKRLDTMESEMKGIREKKDKEIADIQKSKDEVLISAIEALTLSTKVIEEAQRENPGVLRKLDEILKNQKNGNNKAGK